MKWVVLMCAFCLFGTAWSDSDDPYLWLEDIQGDKAMEWVEAQNEITKKALEAVPEYASILKRTTEIMDSKARIPAPDIEGSWIYNFWRDEAHPRGLWRRASLESYESDSPQWEDVLDIDALVAQDGVPWVFHGATFLPPDFRYCMVALSRGGSDAEVNREFDTQTKQFVKDGFEVPEAKTSLAWRDHDHLLVATDYGPDSLTQSGYPRIVKVWKRGEKLEDAKTLYEGKVDDVLIIPMTAHLPDHTYELIVRIPVFFTQETFLRLEDRLVKIDVPKDADFRGVFKDHMILLLRSDWQVGETTYPQGAVIAADVGDFLMGRREFDILFQPTDEVCLRSVTTTRNQLILSTLDNVRSRLQIVRLDDQGWKATDVELPGLGTVSGVQGSRYADYFFFYYEDFLSPDTLFLVRNGTPKKLKSMPPFFSTQGMTVSQHRAVSKDGTSIPYFQVTPKGFKLDGTAPTILYGYGGFENPELPRYSAVAGSAWTARGGVYVVANIRGGGEFGPRWHQSALKENRIKTFEDFIAVAEDLIKRNVTSTPHLGIVGGSQGGLLVAGCMVLRPDLFGAVLSQVPLTDMKRFNKMLAGASWMGEYGNPDIPEEWAYIQTWSPYHLVKKDVTYPTPFFWTTTRDDRVHPGHARKMAAKMMDQGHPVFYFENTEGGHGSGSTTAQRAAVVSLEYAYLWKMLR